ncbi:hypothetical protein FACS1894159_09560 [Bacteroidia bacterium]|nr:hypothetical protein FACS1894159_09560 [Bacteroidia bacterium]
MPFLGMETDGRRAGMAGSGSLLTDSPSAVFGNGAASLAGDKKLGVGLFSGPWSGGDALYGAGGFYRMGEKNALLAGFRYLPGPRIETTDGQGFPLGVVRSRDMAFDVGYGRTIGRGLALSLTARYAIEDQGFGEPLSAFACDLGAMYTRPLRREGASWAIGLRLANLSPGVQGYALPSRAVLGGALTLPFSADHTVACALDAGYGFAASGQFDAAAGVEYTFLRHGVVRGGYHLGSRSRGPGSYATLGCGLIIGPLRCDVAYRLAGEKTNPHNNTVLFSLAFLM